MAKQYDLDTIHKALVAKGSPRICKDCGGSFEMNKDLSIMAGWSGEGPPIMVGGPIRAFAMTTCNKCGQTRFYNVNQLLDKA